MLRARSIVLSAAAAALLGTVTGVADAAADGPPPVRQLAAYATRTGIKLAWTNPNRKRFDDIVVRYIRGTAAPTLHSGHRAGLARPRAVSAQLTNLKPDKTYTAAVWTRQARHATRTSTTFVTAMHTIRRGILRGRVVDTDGNPLANADVFVQDFSTGRVRRVAVTGTDGQFHARLAPVGDLYAELVGSHAVGGNSDATGYAAKAMPIGIRPATTTNLGSVVLDPGAKITGRVTDAAGHPLAGVRPVLAPATPYVQPDDVFAAFIYIGDEIAQTYSRKDGSFTLRGVPQDSMQICYDPTARTVTGNGADRYLARCGEQQVEAAPHSTQPIASVHLESGASGRLVGKVVGPSRKGIAGVFVQVSSLSGSAEQDLFTGARGRYSASGLKPGRYQVCLQPSFGPVSSRTGFLDKCPSATVRVTAGRTEVDDLQLRRGAAATGRLVGPSGKPVPDAFVTFDHRGNDRAESFADAITDADGHFTVKDLPATRYHVCFQPPFRPAAGVPTGVTNACLHHRVAVHIGSVRAGVDAALAAGGALTGSVAGLMHRPSVQASVYAQRVGGGEWPYRPGGAVQKSGRYRLVGLPAGRYRVCADLFASFFSEQIACRKDVVTVSARRTTSSVDLTVPPRASITVHVQDSDGNPLAGVNAAALSACSERYSCSRQPIFSSTRYVRTVDSAVTDRNGNVEFDLLRPKHYALCLFAFYGASGAGTPATGYSDSCSGSTFDIDAKAGATATLTQTLQVAGALTGRVTDAKGNPLRRIRVHVTGSAADNYRADGWSSGDPAVPTRFSRTASDGTFTIRSIESGDQSVCLTEPAKDPFSPGKTTCLSDPVTITAGQTTDLGELTLK